MAHAGPEYFRGHIEHLYIRKQNSSTKSENPQLAQKKRRGTVHMLQCIRRIQNFGNKSLCITVKCLQLKFPHDIVYFRGLYSMCVLYGRNLSLLEFI